MDSPTYPRWVSHFYLRFSRVAEYQYKESHDIRCQIRASMLSLDTMYAASLVFKYREQPNKDLERLKLITIKWKIEELRVCSTHASELIANNWYKIKMWHFINDGPHADFDIVIEELSYCEDPMESELLIQGIEFHPIEMMQHEKNEEDHDDDDEYWENKLPNNYQRLIQSSDKPLHYTNKKDLYLRLCEGFLGDNGQLWFSLCKSIGGICSTLPATSILHNDYNYKRLESMSLPESRFGEVKKLQEAVWYTFECRLQSHMFSPQCIYACYLVFKFEDDHIQPDDTCCFKAWYNLDDVLGDTFFAHLNLSSINIPTIKPKNDYRSHDLSNIPKHNIERLVDSMMEERGDGWMEVMLCKPLHELQDHKSLRLTLSKSKGGSFSGIIVEGVVFRPKNQMKRVCQVPAKGLSSDVLVLEKIWSKPH
uniref:Protein kinase-like domain, phloem protein 2-like protein n=1 Tax=Tanacetum cinerariifolium TaxID=118510 RepID=A0A699I9A7_TANCI|nr:protein kinase-like domain, phloem protein 2-like protein [Tanacetum cinerariifolium]